MFKRTFRKIVILLKKWLGLLTPPVILPYRGFGNSNEVMLAGHVLDDRLLYEARANDRVGKNMRAMMSRYLSTSVPNVRVAIEFLGTQAEVLTDENGHFQKVFYFNPPLKVSGWQPVTYQVLDQIEPGQDLPVSEGEVHVVPGNARFGLISDVDDTILVSHATQTLRKLRLILTKNSKTRLPFDGVSEFYEALRKGPEGQDNNPIFYVSSSAWNLYDFLVDFCRVRGIPKGPFLLQDLKTNPLQLYRAGGGSHQHKLDKIRSLLQLYPDLPFILIGDSGQRDPMLYAETVETFPGRILAVYIRDVSIPKRAAVISRLSSRYQKHEVDMVLVKNTAEAARHAFANGLISKDGLNRVIRETKVEEKQKGSLIGQILENS